MRAFKWKKKGLLMASSLEFLESIGIFSTMSEDELKKISDLVHPIKVKEGETLVQKGKTATTFFIIIRGNFMISFEKGKAITLHNKGDIMGWSSLTPPFVYKATIVALTDSEVLTIPGKDFYQLLQSDSALSDKMMKEIKTIAAARAPLAQ